MADARTFTEAEHEAILTEAVRREVAQATEERDARVVELENQLDVIEAEKAEALTAKEKAEQDLASYRAEIEAREVAAARKDERVAAVQAISAIELPESYFTDERVQRWCEMADEQFNTLLDDMAEQAMASLDDKQVNEVASLEGEARRAKLAEVLAANKGTDEPAGAHVTPPTRETAAFGGGSTPRSPETAEGGTSKLGQWLGARGSAPVTN